MKHFISLGCGVQSSAMALMAAAGYISPMPDAAIFADTQDEPASVYEYLEYLKEQLPFPIHVVTNGKLSARSLKMKVTKSGKKFSATDIPFYTLSAAGERGKIPYRSCTRDFKIYPILKCARKLAGVKRGEKDVQVTEWIGISWDEVLRMKPSRALWCEHRWPLIELKMTRQACLDWIAARGFRRPPRSACVFCPFHNSAEWRRLQTDEPQEFAKAVKFEKALQRAKANSEYFASTPFLHRSCVPLEEIDFRSEEERGQLNFFTNECEGVCGV